MPNPGVIVYRCLRCGALDRSLHSPDILTTLVSVQTNTPDPAASGFKAGRTGLHSCADGAMGVTEFIGAVPDALVELGRVVRVLGACGICGGAVGEEHRCLSCNAAVSRTEAGAPMFWMVGATR